MQTKSKIVAIKQTDSFTLIPKDLRKEFVKRIGSRFDRNTSDVLMGLNIEERQYILPEVIIVNEKNMNLDMATKYREFYADLMIDVPQGKDGVKLNIATYPKDVTVNGKTEKVDFPVAPLDYIKWKQCLVDDRVASSEHDLKHLNTIVHTFLLVDDNIEKDNAIRLQSLMDELDRSYLELTELNADKTGLKKEPKVNAILRLLGKNPTLYDVNLKINELSTSRNEAKVMVRDGVDLKKIPFYSIVKDQDLGVKSHIIVLVTAGILEQQGSSYRDPTNDMVLGNTIEETVNYFKNDANTEHVAKMKFALKGEVRV